MNYKNSRLYEKTISFNALNNTIVKMVLEKNKDVAFDFNKTSMDIINVFNNKTYRFDEIKYINAIPCIYQDDMKIFTLNEIILHCLNLIGFFIFYF